MTPAPTELRRLDEEAFEATAAPPVEDITRDPAAALDIDIWPYAEVALQVEFPDRDCSRWDVRHVYRGADHRHQHVFIRTDRRKVYLVIVLRADPPGILGHHVLDMRRA